MPGAAPPPGAPGFPPYPVHQGPHAPPPPLPGQPGAPPGGAAPGGRRGPAVTLIAVVAGVVVLAVAAVVTVVVLNKPEKAGPDPFAGSYPLVSPPPKPGQEPVTWQPGAAPAGPLRRFPGTATRVVGRIVDRKAGISYARLARPYGKIGIGSHTGGQEFDSNGKDLQTFWYCAVYSSPLDPDLAAAVKAAGKDNGMRAAAELEAKDALKLYSDSKRTDIAGQPLSVGGRRAWLTGVRLDHPKGSRKADVWHMVFIAIDTGRARPAIAEVHVPNTQQRRLPDINTIVKSLRVGS